MWGHNENTPRGEEGEHKGQERKQAPSSFRERREEKETVRKTGGRMKREYPSIYSEGMHYQRRQKEQLGKGGGGDILSDGKRKGVKNRFTMPEKEVARGVEKEKYEAAPGEGNRLRRQRRNRARRTPSSLERPGARSRSPQGKSENTEGKGGPSPRGRIILR